MNWVSSSSIFIHLNECYFMSKQNDLALAEQYFEEGYNFLNEMKPEKAMELFQQSSKFFEKWEEWEGWVKANNKIVDVYFSLGDYEKQIEHLQKTLKIGETYLGKEHPHVASSLNIFGNYYRATGNYDLAISYYQDVLPIRRKSLGEEHPDVIASLNNMANCYYHKGDFELAIGHHKNALSISQKAPETQYINIVESLDGLGTCHATRGEFEIAIPYLQEALTISKKKIGAEHPTTASLLNNLGYCHLKKQKFQPAIPYLQEALALCKKNFGEEHPEVAGFLINLGICYYELKDFDLAISCHQEALSISQKKFGKKHRIVTISLVNLGVSYINKKNYELAIRHVQDALIATLPSFNQKNIFQNPPLKEYGNGHTLLAILYQKTNAFFQLYLHQSQKLKDLQAALATITVATDLVSDIRQNYKDEGSKLDLAIYATDSYHIAMKVALKTIEAYEQLSEIPPCDELTNIPYTIEGIKSLALDFAEQFKSILLLSRLKDNEAKTASNISEELIAKEKQLQEQLNDFDKKIATQKTKSKQKETPEDTTLLSELQQQHFNLKLQYNALIEQFETEYPKYHQLKYSISTASVQDLQLYLSGVSHKVSDTYSSKSALLSYHIANDKIYIFSITSNDYQIKTVEKPSNFSQLVEKLQGDIQLGSVKEFIQSATQLFDVLLRPVWGFLQSVSKLIIIPHGELYYVPFDVLLNQHQITDTKNFENLPYLIRDFDISYHYSATLLLHSHQRQLQTSEQIDSFFGLAPVHFGGEGGSEKKEGYVVKSSGKQAKRNRRILKSSGNAQEALKDLEETELEVKEVYQLFEEQGKEAIALFYDQANKQNLKEYIGGYKYVLISTHGFLQEAGKNTLSGIHLASRQTVDDGRQTADDYILHTSETYHLNLNADLVVLSSCESGVGELKVGEGMMALHRAFLYAGASNIVYSLFQVPEDSTRQLVEALFRYILEGDNYGAALRKAKLDLINDGAMEPMDWAGFALVGG